MRLCTTEQVNTACRLCFAKCGIILHLENGKIVKVEGDSDDSKSQGYLCPKGKAIAELVNAPDRLKYPLKRDGNTWKRISWDEALDIIARNLKKIKESYGDQAVLIHMGQAGVAQDIRPFIQRFCNVFRTPNFSSAGSQCHVARVMGNTLTYGCLPIPDHGNAKCIIVWGHNPAASSPLAMRSILKARVKGAKLIVIDPRVTPLARKADMHIQIRPGTDGALALGMLNLIISDDLWDKEFVKEWTIGFDKLGELIQEYPIERVEKITWIPATLVRKVGQLYGTIKPACISLGNALEHHTNAIQSIRAISILQAITGNLDIPGGSIFNQGAPLADISLSRETHLSVNPVGAVEHTLFQEFAHQAQANLLSEAILSSKPYPVKGMIITGANPVLTWPNAEKTRKALKQLEFLVVMDLFMTETAKMAHMVLPATTFLERTELFDHRRNALDGQLELYKKVLSETEECWSDWKFWTELAKKMGYREFFPWNNIEEAFDFQLKPLGISVEQLKKEPSGIIYGDKKYKKYEREGFKTPSGKVEIYSEKLKKFGYDPLPVYKEPDESPVSKPDLAKEYPLVLTTGGRILEYIHSRFRNLTSLHQRVPEPWIEIHTETAKELGVKDGEEVIVESLRGGIGTKAKFTESILPGVVQICHGWSKANANILTDDEACDPISGFPPLRSLLCRVRKKGIDKSC